MRLVKYTYFSSRSCTLRSPVLILIQYQFYHAKANLLYTTYIRNIPGRLVLMSHDLSGALVGKTTKQKHSPISRLREPCWQGWQERQAWQAWQVQGMRRHRKAVAHVELVQGYLVLRFKRSVGCFKQKVGSPPKQVSKAIFPNGSGAGALQ